VAVDAPTRSEPSCTRVCGLALNAWVLLVEINR